MQNLTNSILNDKQIAYLVETQEMITPFIPSQVRQRGDAKVISYGLSSFGYDIRIASPDFRVYNRPEDSSVIDPKKLNSYNLETYPLVMSGNSSYYTMPPHSYALAVSVEKFKIPENITVVAVGKSTYARSGILVNITPLEAGWEGYLTLELANLTPLHCRVYTNEGIAQLLFFKGDRCTTSYKDRNGKYQNQANHVVLPKV